MRFVISIASTLLLFAGGALFAESAPGFLDSENIFDDALSLDLKVNGSDGPIEVAVGERIVISWVSEGATRCRGSWSKGDISLFGNVSGKLGKMAVVRMACVDASGNREDDAVTVNVISQPPQTEQPAQSAQTITQQSQPVRKSSPPVRLNTAANQPGVVLPASYPIRTLTLDTLGNTVQATQSDIQKEGQMSELAGGQTIKSWKIKYEKKGHARFVCDPPVLNVSFDKKDSKGNKRELFTGASTYPGRPQLQYQKIRMIPLCEAEQYYNPSTDSYAGFHGKVDAQLREYFTFLTLRSIGTPAVDVVGFANLSFVSPDAQYNGKSFRYMLLQRDNEQDDELPFTEQFNLEPTLIEDGKYNAAVSSPGNSLLGDFTYTWTAPGANGEQLTMRRDPDNVLKNLLVSVFVQDWDRAILHNEDYGKVKSSDIWETMTYGFDWIMYTCNTDDNLQQMVKNRMGFFIDTLPQDQQKIYKAAYYRVARELFSNQNTLARMHAIVDNFPFPDNGGKKLLNDYIDVAFYRYGSYFSSSEFAAYTGVSQSSFTPLPFPSSAAFERAQGDLYTNCWQQTPQKDTGAKVEVSSATLKRASGTISDSEKGGGSGDGEYLQADFSVALTAPEKQEISISKTNAFVGQLAGPKTTKKLQSYNSSWSSWKSYERPAELAETVGPAWVIPAGKTARFFVTFKYELSPAKYVEGGSYEEREYGYYIASLQNIVLAANASPLIPPKNNTNTVTIFKPLSVACSAFSPSLIPIGREVKWVATADGGDGGYIYSWSGTDGLNGNATTTTKSYTVGGAKSATVVVKSGGESKTSSCGGVTIEQPIEVITLTINDSFFVRAKNIVAGAPNQILSGFYVGIFKNGQQVTTFPVPTATARTITFTLSNVSGDAVRDVTLQTMEGNVLAGPVDSLLKGKAFFVLDGPIVLKDNGTYVLRGKIDSSVREGTQVATSLVGISMTPDIGINTTLPVTSSPGTVVAPMPTGAAHSQFASPFFADLRLFFGALFNR